MKVKIVTGLTTSLGELKPGQVLNVKPKVAKNWIMGGMAVKTK